MSDGTKEMDRLFKCAVARGHGRPRLSYEYEGKGDERRVEEYVLEVGSFRARVDAGAGALAAVALRMVEQLRVTT